MVVHEAVDGRRGSHGILEDAVPFAEGQVARDEQRPALVALCHQREEDLDLLGALLDVPDVIEDEQLERNPSTAGVGDGRIEDLRS